MGIDRNRFFEQARLMLQALPFVFEEEIFALKGGSAINFFFRDMPRLSVDIDLTYLPLEPRERSLRNIEKSLKRIAQRIGANLSGVSIQEGKIKDPYMTNKIFVGIAGMQIKIEPNLVIRGTAFPAEEHILNTKAQEAFELFIEARTVSFADAFGGKICAALDRQHPRDLYDIKFLLDKEGITEKVRKGFLVYLISHDRPLHESLNPVMKEFEGLYEREFKGMTREDVSYEELVNVRHALVAVIHQTLTDVEKDFLMSFKGGEPDWGLLGVEGVQDLPAVRWKLSNIQKMEETKRRDFMIKLRNVLKGNYK